MSAPSHTPKTSVDTLKVKLGNWFEAQATGWGVLAIPAVLLLLIAAALAVRLMAG